jgi:hypothetical protein
MKDETVFIKDMDGRSPLELSLEKLREYFSGVEEEKFHLLKEEIRRRQDPWAEEWRNRTSPKATFSEYKKSREYILQKLTR